MDGRGRESGANKKKSNSIRPFTIFTVKSDLETISASGGRLLPA